MKAVVTLFIVLAVIDFIIAILLNIPSDKKWLANFWSKSAI